MKYPIGSVGHAWITFRPIFVALPVFLYLAYFAGSAKLTSTLAI